jgi:hypothetical protein
VLNLSRLTPAEREALAALIIKAKIQQPAASHAYSEADHSAETKPSMAGKTAFSLGSDASGGSWRSPVGKTSADER